MDATIKEQIASAANKLATAMEEVVAALLNIPEENLTPAQRAFVQDGLDLAKDLRENNTLEKLT